MNADAYGRASQSQMRLPSASAIYAGSQARAPTADRSDDGRGGGGSFFEHDDRAPIMQQQQQYPSGRQAGGGSSSWRPASSQNQFSRREDDVGGSPTSQQSMRDWQGVVQQQQSFRGHGGGNAMPSRLNNHNNASAASFPFSQRGSGGFGSGDGDQGGSSAGQRLSPRGPLSSAAQGTPQRGGGGPLPLHPSQPQAGSAADRSILSASVAVLSPSDAAARRVVHGGGAVNASGGGGGGFGGATPAGFVASVASAPLLKDRPEFLVDHQTYLEFKRAEYRRRVEAEARGETFRPSAFSTSGMPYSDDFVNALPGNSGGGGDDFISRSRDVLGGGGLQSVGGGGKTQIIGTRSEVAWLQPPPIPAPVGYNGFWDLCAGHEAVLQVMALSGSNPENSPSLTEHFMYPELLSAVQRLQFGTYMVHYQKGEPPHERYFYVKSLPLANRGQFCPFFCWSVHRHAHTAEDTIPLCNVMWVTQGIDGSEAMQKYWIGGKYMHGPFVGKYRSECLVHGAMTVWVYDGRKLRSIDVLAPDPLVFTLWMKLLEDFAQLNAALDLTGNVRAMQRDIERSKDLGELGTRERSRREKSKMLSIFS